MRNKLPKDIILPHASLLLAIVLWAIAGPVIKLTLQDVPVFTFLLYRLLIVGIILLPYLFFQLQKDPINKQDLPSLILYGIVCQASLPIIFFAYEYTTALDVAIITTAGPILTFIAGRYYFREKITKLEIFGLLLAIMGTSFVVLSPVLTNGSAVANKRLLGNFLAFLFQLTMPIYIILGKHLVGKSTKEVSKSLKFLHLKRLSKKYNPNTVTAFSFYVGLAFFIPAGLIEANSANYVVNFSSVAIQGILYMALFSSIVAYAAYQWGLKDLEAQETAVYSYLAPIFTLPAAYVLLGEVPTEEMLMGAAIIAVGVFIAEKFKS